VNGSIDVAALRATTPGVRAVAHFNSAGASLPDEATLSAVIGHLRREAMHGPHEAAALVQRELLALRRDAADLLSADSDEVAFTSSGSAGWGLAFAALPPLQAGDRILVGRQEWGGNLATMHQAAARTGATVEIIATREDGSADPEALTRMIDDRVRLVALTWLPANGGLINDAAAIGAVTRAAGVPYFIDAGQALGQVPTDVRELGCDVLKGAGRKHLRGPRGTALLYVRAGFREVLHPPFLDVLSGPWLGDAPDVRKDARVFETSEVSVALLLGLAAALRQALDIGVSDIRSRTRALAKDLRDRLANIPGVTLQDLGLERSGLVSFTLDHMSVGEVRQALAARQINVAVSGASYTPLDMTARGLAGIVRASVSYITTEDEIECLVEAVAELASRSV
jgi:cysteine desulfurase/selenocysteine lyase